MAGATAHEINNATQGLANLLTLAAQPGVSRATLERLAAQARERLAACERLARQLNLLARVRDADSVRPQRLEHIVAEALIETETTEGRSIVLAPPPADVWVRGNADALRAALRGLLAYGLAAAPPDAALHLRLAVHAPSSVVTIDVPPLEAARTAPSPPGPGDAAGALLPVGGAHGLGGDFGVMLAGALAAQLGGDLRAGELRDGGLRFAFSLPLAPRPG